MKQNYSVARVSEELIVEVKQALKSVKSYGSVEIYIQKGIVTQITVRNIKKTAALVDGSSRNRSNII